MNKDAFMNQVQDILQLPSREMAEAGVQIVLSLLSHRLTPEESKQVADQLPQDLKNVWNSDTWVTNFLSISHQGQLKYRHKGELFSLIRNEIEKKQLPVGAEPLAKAVFHVLKAQISQGEVADVASQLPEDIENVWLAA